jgi:hypothetical protein
MCIDWETDPWYKILYEYRNFNSHWKIFIIDFTENFELVQVCCCGIRSDNTEEKIEINKKNDENDNDEEENEYVDEEYYTDEYGNSILKKSLRGKFKRLCF